MAIVMSHWFYVLRSERLKNYIRGVHLVERHRERKWRPLLYVLGIYGIAVELHRTYLQEEWNRGSWVPHWVLHSRREHYINSIYAALRSGRTPHFTFSNWDPNTAMMYHVDREGQHNFERIVLPAYHYGALKDPWHIEHFSRLAVYNVNKAKRYDIDNYLRHRTVTLGDWITALYYYFNTWTNSFDPFWYRPDFIEKAEVLYIALNLRRDDKPSAIVDLVKYLRLKAQDPS